MKKDSNDLKDYPHIDLLYPSKYLRAADLRGKDVTLTIAGIEPRHELRRADNSAEAKPVVSFEETDRLWVMNRTNARRVAEHHGVDATKWIGKKVVLITEKVPAFGKMHDAIRVREK